MCYKVEVQTRRGGVMTWHPFPSKAEAEAGMRRAKKGIAGVQSDTWKILPMAPAEQATGDDHDRLLHAKVTLFDPADAEFVRGPFHLVGPRLKWDLYFHEHTNHPETFVHATGEHAGLWLLQGNRDDGDDATDAQRGAFRYATTPERLAFLSALADEQPGLHDPRYREMHTFRGWNGRVDVLREPRLFRKVFPELTNVDHERLALDYHRQHLAAHAKWHDAIAEASRAHGAGEHPYRWVSGGFQEHWPSEAKSTVRRLAHAAGDLLDAAGAHWRASGRRVRPPWAQRVPRRAKAVA